MPVPLNAPPPSTRSLAGAGSPARFWMLAIVVAGALVRIAFWSGYPGTDDTYYIDAARRLAADDLGAFTSYFSVRTAIVMPTALLFRVFGASTVTSAIVPFICSLGEIAVAFALGRRMFGDRVGLLAAGLMAILPLDVIFASELFPNVPIGLFTGLCLHLLLRDEARKGDRRTFLTAGIALGFATLAGEVALFCLLPIAWFFVAHAKSRAGALRFAAGLAAVLTAECLLYGILTGNPLLRFTLLVSQHGGTSQTTPMTVGFVVQPFLRLLTEQELGLFPYLLAPALVYHVRRQPRARSRFLVLWIAAVCLYTWYGPRSARSYDVLPRLPRYLTSVTIPALVLLASYLATLRATRRWLVVGALGASSLGCVWIDNGRAVKQPRRDLHAFIEANPDARFVLERRLLFDELFYRGFRPTPRVTATTDVAAAIPEAHGAFVAVMRDSREAPRRSPGVELAARFVPADRLYHRLLRNPTFMGLIAPTRDAHRMKGLGRISTEGIDVYRVR